MPVKRELKNRRIASFIAFTFIGAFIGILLITIIIYKFPMIIENVMPKLKHDNVKPLNTYISTQLIQENETENSINDLKYQQKDHRCSLEEPIHVFASTNFGKIRGIRIKELGILLNQFLSVPFATPPLGNLRFKPTVPLNTQWNSVIDATQWPPLCYQINWIKNQSILHMYNNDMSEDCLYLNIWAPAVDISLEINKLPVMVFIHGGGYTSGGVSNEEYNGRTIAAVGNVIVVTIQYRLGVLGFLETDIDDVPGNAGLYDQITALLWIKDNIGNFGGDPNQITLFGQSAGGVSIGLLMTAPDSKKLFRRAILESGTPTVFNMAYNFGAKTYQKISESIGCTDSVENEDTATEDIVKCLIQLPVEKLIDAQEKSMLVFSPSIPSDLIPLYPNEAICDDTDEDIYQTEVLIGANTDEGNLILHLALPEVFPDSGTPQIKDTEEARNVFAALGKNYDISESELKVFAQMVIPDMQFNDSSEITKYLASNIGDILFKCPSLKMAELLYQKNVSVYLYYFTQRSSQSLWPQWMGVTHHDEIPFVFGLPLRFPHLYDGDEIELSKRIIKTWSHFAKTGQMLPQLDTEWSRYDVNKTENHMEMNGKSASIGNALNSDCVMFDMAYNILSQIDINN